MKGGRHRASLLGVRGASFRTPENSEISCPRKGDFNCSEGNLAHFNTSFLKVKMPFLLPQNETKLCKNDANLH